MSPDFTNNQSILVQVMAWCCQATSHYLSQCWPRSLSLYGVTRPEWVNGDSGRWICQISHCNTHELPSLWLHIGEFRMLKTTGLCVSLCPQKLREQAYISLVRRSQLEYCAAIWDPHLEKDTQQLEAIQRRAARFVVQDFSRYSSVQSYLNDLKWAPLKDRRRDIRLTFLFKIVTGRVAVQAEGTLLPADSRTRHRHKHKYRHLPATCNQSLNSFFVKTIPDWNSLPEACITADTVTAFQSRLRCPP